MGRRGNSEGSIRKRKDGRWEARATVKYDPATGRLKRISRYFKTRKEALDWLAEVIHSKNIGSFVEPAKETFGDWILRWLDIYVKTKVEPTSYANYYDTVTKHILPLLGAIPILALRTSAIQELYNQKAQTLSP